MTFPLANLLPLPLNFESLNLLHVNKGPSQTGPSAVFRAENYDVAGAGFALQNSTYEWTRTCECKLQW